MAKPEWGVKRSCMTCGARFYDMRRTPVVCPKCDAVQDLDAPPKLRRGDRKKDVVKPVAPPTPVDDDALEPDLDADLEADEEEDEADLMEDPADLGEDDNDLDEVKEHLELDDPD